MSNLRTSKEGNTHWGVAAKSVIKTSIAREMIQVFFLGLNTVSFFHDEFEKN